jgi:hypothetical protein
VRLVRYADEPDLRAIRFEALSQQTFPEYMQNNVPGNKYCGRLATGAAATSSRTSG